MMKITQFSAISLGSTVMVTGLGDDNKIYNWESRTGEWVLCHFKPALDAFPTDKPIIDG